MGEIKKNKLESKSKSEFIFICYLLTFCFSFHICALFCLIARYFKQIAHNCLVRELVLFILGLSALSSSKFISPVFWENIVHLSIPPFES